MDPNLTIEEFEHAGMHVRVGWDDCYDSAWTNPRHHDGNFGSIVMRQSLDLSGALGPNDESQDEWEVECECEGGERRDRESPTGYSECPDCEGLGWLTHDALHHARAEGARAAIGIFYVAHGPQHGVRTNAIDLLDDELGNADGIIFDTPNAIRERGWEHRPIADVCAALEEELNVWNWYLEGRVYVYEVEDANGVLVDSCGGMLAEDEDYCKSEAIASAEAHAKDAEHESATSDDANGGTAIPS